jgi:hypothetical protein
VGDKICRFYASMIFDFVVPRRRLFIEEGSQL